MGILASAIMSSAAYDSEKLLTTSQDDVNFLFLTCKALTRQTGTCVEGSSSGLFHGNVEIPHHCAFVNPVAVQDHLGPGRKHEMLIGTQRSDIYDFNCTLRPRTIFAILLATSLW